jgi:hypothetical protein
MTRQRRCRSRSAVKRSAGSGLLSCKVDRVMRALEAATSEGPRQTDPFLEQLRQCPEAFKAGEMIGTRLDSLKYSQVNDATTDRYLPPAGAVIPPLV